MRPWPKVRLGEVLSLDLDRVPVDAATSYPMVGVLSFGRGLFDREPIENGKTSYKYFSRLKADHVVMSQLFGWEGALALSSEKFAGKFVSPQFPTFICNPMRLDRYFLGWAMRRPTFWDDLGKRTSGMGDRRRTLNPEALFACEIPLPPLQEQRRIVARIEELSSLINEANTLCQQVIEENDTLLISMAHRADLNEKEKDGMCWRQTFLQEALRLVDDSHKVLADSNYPNFGIYSFGRGLFNKQPIEGLTSSAQTLRKVQKGQFIYSRLFAFEGAYGMVTEELDGFYVSNEYPTFECVLDKVRPEFLVSYFKSPKVWREISAGSKGLGDRRQRVQPDRILAYPIWLPPLPWQHLIAEVYHMSKALRRAQTQSAAELDALLPAVLDRAFRGEFI